MRQHRYAESIELSKEAIRIDPKDWYSLADLGQNYLRLGDDAKGLQLLRQAWNGDKFNVRTYQPAQPLRGRAGQGVRLRLLAALQAARAQGGAGAARAHRGAAPRARLRRLRRSATASARPGRSSSSSFAIPATTRCAPSACPGLAALGVCFGRVITSVSPLGGRFNWGQVLWHELNHVFTIQMSRSRVPRWLTEGLADLEPTRERAEWKRENDFDIYRALRGGRLRGFAGMSTAFTQAKSLEDMVVAYYQGMLMVSFLIENWGFDKLVGTLGAYARSKRSEEILPALTGLPLAELDRRFRDREAKRLAHYGKSWYLDGQAYQDVAAREKAASARPADAAAQAELAAAYLVAGKAREADAQADKALGLDGKNRIALYVAAKARRARGDEVKAAALLGRLVAAGGDGYEARFELGSLALARNDLRPGRRRSSAPPRSSTRSAPPPTCCWRGPTRRPGRRTRSSPSSRSWPSSSSRAWAPSTSWSACWWQRQDWAAVRRYGLMGYYIDPGLGEACTAPWPAPSPRRRRRPELDQAIWHLETALLAKPERPLELHLELAKLHLRRKDRGQSARAARQGARLDPNHAEARALLAPESSSRQSDSAGAGPGRRRSGRRSAPRSQSTECRRADFSSGPAARRRLSG